MTVDASPRRIAIVGTNPTRLWGLTGETRIARIARANGFAPVPGGEDATLVADAGYAFDPLWLRHLARTPGTVLTSGGAPVIGHARAQDEARALAAGIVPPAMTVIAAEAGGTIENEQLRKRETPFVAPLIPANVAMLERASYFGAYKGVTDLLTKYLWPEWALVLTRIAARIGMTPNQVTAIGALLCITATVAFWFAHYWAGMAMGLGFMVLDTVDGKLARCTITSSKWGNVFDHGIDLVHPPFWWVAWAVGLSGYGRPLGADTLWWTLTVILGGYVVQRAIEGAFMRLYGMHVHVWRRFDSRFRLVTARRNPNMVILFFATLAGRPDIGLVAVAWWTAISLVVHGVQLGQAMRARGRGETIRSWIA